MQSGTQELRNQNQALQPSLTARVLSTVAVVALGVLVWWAVEIRTAAPPPPAGVVADPARPVSR